MRNFIFIFVILLFAGCTKSGKNIDIEQKYNIYISKLSDEEIEESEESSADASEKWPDS